MTRVQAKKAHCIQALSKLRLERQKIEAESENTLSLVDDWIAAVMDDDREVGNNGG